MIPDAILGLLTTILNGLYALLPNWNWNPLSWEYSDGSQGTHQMYQNGIYVLNDGSGSWVNTPGSPLRTVLFMMKQWNSWLPVDQFALIINFMIVYAVAWLAYKGTIFLINVVRGSGASMN